MSRGFLYTVCLEPPNYACMLPKLYTKERKLSIIGERVNKSHVMKIYLCGLKVKWESYGQITVQKASLI